MSTGPDHKVTTLCLLRHQDRVLLAMKKRGFGAGKWNGYGGKVMPGESIEASVKREAQEEGHVVLRNLRNCGLLHFSFEGSDLTIECHVFWTDAWDGTPEETEEMAPRWFPANALPYGEMWAGDPLWMPLLLSGRTFAATFHFSADQKTVLSHEVVEQT